MSVRRLDPVQPDSFAFSADNLAWARKTIAKYPEGKQASAVIPLLWRAQEQNDGWVSKPAIEYVADMLGMSYIRVLEVATFYTMFQLSPVGRKAHVQVCGTTPCMLRGAEELKAVCRNRIHRDPHHISADGDFSWEEVECLGSCVNAPMVQIFKDTYEDLTPADLEKLIDDIAAGRKVKPGPQNGRQHSAPDGGPTTLTDPALYAGTRSFTRVEPAPQPAAAQPQPQAAAPAKAEVAAPAKTEAAPAAKPEPAPKAEPVAVAAAKPIIERKAGEAAPADTKPATPAPVAPPKPVAEQKTVAITSPDAPKPIRLSEQEIQPARKAAAKKPKGDGAPELLKKPRAGSKADDLELIWGVGPKLAKMLNGMGIWHFDQIAKWTARELAWVDARLGSFKGRAERDDWIGQCKKLATGWRPDNAIGEKPRKK